MNTYIVKIRDEADVRKVTAKNDFIHGGIYNFEDEIEVGDPVFIYFGGDSARISWQQGLAAIGKVIRKPFDKGSDTNSPRNFKIKIEVLHTLPSPISPVESKIHSRLSSQLFDIPFVGAKHFPNQAISKIDEGPQLNAICELCIESDKNAIYYFDILKLREDKIKKCFNAICRFCKDYSEQANPLNTNDKKVQDVKSVFKELSYELNWILAIDRTTSKLKIVFSQGMGSFPFVPWICILGNNQKVSNGVFVSVCFDHKGRGAIAGLARSVTNLPLLKLQTKKRTPLDETNLDVDSPSRKAEQMFNDSFVNPKEFFVGNISTIEFISHLKSSMDSYCEHLQEVASKNESTDLQSFEALSQTLSQAGLIVSVSQLIRFVCSLLTKPFVILTGLSGSGKTKLAQAFVKWICGEESQYKIIPVGADWTNREPLFGYPNALEIGEYVKPDNGVLDFLLEASKPDNDEKPFFLILDEMNLSHVERYFADFLSAMESGEAIPLHADGPEWKTIEGYWKEEIPDKITIPNNLFIIGTVNIDETTYMFSPKVLDRAGVIEFRITEGEMEKFLLNPVKPDLESINGAGARMAGDFVKKARQDYTEFANQEEIKNCLNKFFSELKKASAEFGYRSASEIFRFAAVMPTITKEITTDEIIDAAVIQKLLPKLHGSRRKLEPILKTLASLCLHDAAKVDEILKEEKKSDYKGDTRVRLPLSIEKIIRMYHRAVHDGFTSFAEA